MQPVPIMFLSDSPGETTGLARITRDLALLTSRLPEFRVATLGRGVRTRAELPFPQYVFDVRDQWGEEHIEWAWNNFAKDRPGIVFTISDASRYLWFGAPQFLEDSPLKTFLASGKFQRWGYFPVDAEGINYKLSNTSCEALRGYDRILAYSKFGQGILKASSGVSEIDFIPHGITNTVFTPRDKYAGRLALGVPEDAILLGCVMTNQARKDWGTWALIIKNLQAKYKNVWAWAHTDTLDRYWNLNALIDDLGLSQIRITMDDTDLNLSYYYSACDVTILPSLGEGFGYPILESLCCGVPIVHTSYGAGGEISPKVSTVSGANLRVDTINNIVRPVLDFSSWALVIEKVLEDRETPESYAASVSHLHWQQLWPVWKEWLLKGLR